MTPPRVLPADFNFDAPAETAPDTLPADFFTPKPTEHYVGKAGTPEFARGVKAGETQVFRSFGASLEALGASLGLDRVRDWGKTIRESQEEVAKELAPRVLGLEEVRGSKDLYNWVTYNLGQAIPSMVSMAAGAFAGGTPGALAVSYPMAAGDVYANLKAKGVDSPATAALAGVPIAALDILTPKGAVNRALTEPVEKSLLRAASKEAWKSAKSEFWTEGAQEVLGVGAEAAHGKADDLRQIASRVANAAAAGGLAGGVFGGAAGAVETTGAPKPRQGELFPSSESVVAGREAGTAPLVAPSPVAPQNAPYGPQMASYAASRPESFAVGALVETPRGRGTVVDFLEKDGERWAEVDLAEGGRAEVPVEMVAVPSEEGPQFSRRNPGEVKYIPPSQVPSMDSAQNKFWPVQVLPDGTMDVPTGINGLNSLDSAIDLAFKLFKPGMKIKILDQFGRTHWSTEENLGSNLPQFSTRSIDDLINARDSVYHATDLEGFKGILDAEMISPNPLLHQGFGAKAVKEMMATARKKSIEEIHEMLAAGAISPQEYSALLEMKGEQLKNKKFWLIKTGAQEYLGTEYETKQEAIAALEDCKSSYPNAIIVYEKSPFVSSAAGVSVSRIPRISPKSSKAISFVIDRSKMPGARPFAEEGYRKTEPIGQHLGWETQATQEELREHARLWDEYNTVTDPTAFNQVETALNAFIKRMHAKYPAKHERNPLFEFENRTFNQPIPLSAVRGVLVDRSALSLTELPVEKVRFKYGIPDSPVIWESLGVASRAYEATGDLEGSVREAMKLVRNFSLKVREPIYNFLVEMVQLTPGGVIRQIKAAAAAKGLPVRVYDSSRQMHGYRAGLARVEGPKFSSPVEADLELAQSYTVEAVDAALTTRTRFGEHPIFDPQGLFSPDELREIADDPDTKKVLSAVSLVGKKVVALLRLKGLFKGTPLEGLGTKVSFGLTFDPRVNGVFLGGRILVNPIGMSLEDTSPAQMASRLAATIVHELIHDKIPNHYEDFVAAQRDIYAALGDFTAAIQKELTDAYSDEGGNLRPGLTLTAQAYFEGAQRRADLLGADRGEGMALAGTPTPAGSQAVPPGQPPVGGVPTLGLDQLPPPRAEDRGGYGFTDPTYAQAEVIGDATRRELGTANLKFARRLTPEEEWRLRTGFRSTVRGFGATEGEGLYLSETESFARTFGGSTVAIEYLEPRNPLVVTNEPLYLLHADEKTDIFEPSKKGDSLWLSLHKEAVARSEVSVASWGPESESRLSRALTQVMRERGYDAVKIDWMGDRWIVLLDENLIVSGGGSLQFSKRELPEPAKQMRDEVGKAVDALTKDPDVRANIRADMDRFNLLSKTSMTLLNWGWENPHVEPLQRYIRTIEQWSVLRNDVLLQADKLVEEMRRLGKDRQRKLAELVFIVGEKSFKAGKRLDAREVMAEARKLKVDEETFSVYQRIDAQFSRDLDGLEKALLADADKRYAGKTDFLSALGLQGEKAQIQREMGELRNRNYFPRTRFGKHTIVIKMLEKTTWGERTYRKGERVVLAYESKLLRDREYKQVLSELGSKALVKMDMFTDSEYAFMGFPPSLLSSLKDDLELNDEQIKELKQRMFDLSPGHSFVKHLKHAKGIQGFSRDLPRVFSEYHLHFANHLARISFQRDLQQAIHDLNESASAITTGDAATRRLMAQEVGKHYKFTMNPGNDLAALRGWIFNFFFAYVPKQLLVNLTQVPFFTHPHLAATSGLPPGKSDVAAAKAILKAIHIIGGQFTVKDAKKMAALAAAGGAAAGALVGPAGAVAGGAMGALYGVLNRASFVAQAGLDPEYQQLIARGVKEGWLDQSYATEVAGMAHGNVLSRMFPSSLPGGYRLDKLARAVTEFGTTPFKISEEWNRRVSAVAAFMMARSRGENFEKAVLFAKDTVQRTQGEYSRWNRIPLARGKMAVPFIFKTFLQNSLYFAARDPGGRRYLLAMLVFAGAVGLPLAEDILESLNATGTWIRSWLGVRNPKLDLEKTAREIVTEVGGNPDLFMHGLGRETFGLGTLGRLVGVPVPELDFSGSLAQGRVVPGLTPALKATQGTISPRELIGDVAVEALGPTGNVGMGMLRGWMENSAADKAYFEKLPVALRSLAKATRMSREGRAVDSRGETLVKFSPLDPQDQAEILGQMFGITPASISRTQEANWHLREAVQYYTVRRERMLTDFAVAVGSKDREAIADVKGALAKFNDQVPTPFIITGQDLRLSLLRRLKNQALRDAGLPTQKEYYQLYQEFHRAFPSETVASPPQP